MLSMNDESSIQDSIQWRSTDLLRVLHREKIHDDQYEVRSYKINADVMRTGTSGRMLLLL